MIEYMLSMDTHTHTHTPIHTHMICTTEVTPPSLKFVRPNSKRYLILVIVGFKLLFFISLLLLCVCAYARAHTLPQLAYGGQRTTFRSHFTLSTMWILGIGLKSSALETNTLPQGPSCQPQASDSCPFPNRKPQAAVLSPCFLPLSSPIPSLLETGFHTVASFGWPRTHYGARLISNSQ